VPLFQITEAFSLLNDLKAYTSIVGTSGRQSKNESYRLMNRRPRFTMVCIAVKASAVPFVLRLQLLTPESKSSNQTKRS